MLQLKKIGRKFREQKEEAEKKVIAFSEEKKKLELELEKKVAALEEQKMKLEEELAKKASERPSGPSGAVSSTQGDKDTHKLLEESMERTSALETETERLKAENEELQKISTLKEERAKTVLKTAQAKIQKFEDEKKKLELELEQIGESNAC